MPKRPNFLLFITDQQRHDHLGCTGNPFVQTPHLDRLAAAGTIIDEFYVATPVCMPNRASLMTGRMPSLHGSRHNGIPLDLDATTFVQLLRATGYQTALIGKSHLQAMSGAPPRYSPEPIPSGYKSPDPLYAEAQRKRYERVAYETEDAKHWHDPEFEPPLPYYGFDYVRLCSNHGDAGSAHYKRWFEANNRDAKQKPGPENALENSPHHPQAYKSAVPPELHPTSYIADETMAYLQDYAAGDQAEPFFIQCSFPDPHHPFAVPGQYWDMYDPDEIAIPRSFYTATHDQIPPLRLLAEKSKKSTTPDFFTEPFIFDEATIREVTAKTFGMITFIDAAIGNVLARLDALGLADNTVICFVSDHGDWMGDHGLLLKDALHYQSLIRVPFIWRDPDPTYNNGLVAARGNFLDISRTILARAKIAPNNGHQGRDLLPILAGDDAASRNSVLIEQTTHVDYLGVPANTRIFSLIDGRPPDDCWRLTVWEGQSWGELYNLSQDPDELVNLWDDPAQAQIKSDLLLKMVQQMQTLNDNSPFPVWRA